MKDCNCGYCMGGEILAGFGIKICDLQVSQLILFKEQSHPGRVIVAYKDHVSELVDISDEERNLFFADVATAATPLAVMKEGAFDQLPEIADMFLGFVGGSLGETSALALLVGFVYLLIRKVISWQIPVAYIGTVALVSLISAPAGIGAMDYMLYSIFGGGLMLGAIFMATDYATSPVTKAGQLVFGIGCGLLTVFIRRFGSYPEGVCYSILVMNCCTWLLDKYIKPTIYGAPKKEKKEAAAK